MDTVTTPTSASQELEHLEVLKHHLAARGFRARVVQPRSKPTFLRVVNIETGQLSEDITCAQAEGELCFLWSWGTPITPVRHPESAAERVAYVLRP
jgi:hypothetical protein